MKIKIISDDNSIPIITENIHYFSWNVGKFASETISKNCPDLSKEDIKNYFERADREDCITLYPRCNITILSASARFEENIYRIFNKALEIQRNVVHAEYCIFDMRNYRYCIPAQERACFPYERSLDGTNNSEYIWMIRTRGYTDANNIVWIRSADHNNSHCTSCEISVSQAPFQCFSANISTVLLENQSVEYADNPTYSEFLNYYRSDFAADINAMFNSYLKEYPDGVTFHGFGRDYLINIDTVLLRFSLGKKSVCLPCTENMANFVMAIWTVVVSDLIVYNQHFTKAKNWSLVTRYPKFTSWNYNATKPSSILTLFIDCFPELHLQEQIQKLIDTAGIHIVQNLINDMSSMLGFTLDEKKRASFFATSWLTFSGGGGEPFDDLCFLY